MMNRRNWLKSGLMGLGGVSLLPSTLAASQSSTLGVLKELTPPIEKTKGALKARLLANENPFGPSKKAIDAITAAVADGNRYAHQDANYLISMIAEQEGVAPESIMLGPGSTDLLEKTAIVLAKDGGNVISADPSYMSLVNTAKAVGATWKAIPLAADYSHDLEAMSSAIDTDSKLIYVCNPNNPMGAITKSAPLEAFCKVATQKVPVFVDEAYLEFMEDGENKSMVGLVAEGYDVIVARTFSKIYGMAGLRIGYIVATPERINSITSVVRSTMGLCSTSLKGAIASFGDTAYLENCRELNKASRDYTYAQLKGLGYEPIPSQTSFMIFPIRTEGKVFAQSMLDQGVGIRTYQIFDMPWCRVSMGTKEEMKLFINALAAISG